MKTLTIPMSGLPERSIPPWNKSKILNQTMNMDSKMTFGIQNTRNVSG